MNGYFPLEYAETTFHERHSVPSYNVSVGYFTLINDTNLRSTWEIYRELNKGAIQKYVQFQQR